MTWKPSRQTWTGKQAVLFVHGVGNTQPGDYDPLVQEFLTAVGDNAGDIATYFLYYDDINDSIREKLGDIAEKIDKLKNLVKKDTPDEKDVIHADIPDDGPTLGEAVAEVAGDVLFPVVDEVTRTWIQKRIFAQLQQMRLDGDEAGVPFHRQKVSIVCHSLGCFHTYEALHKAAVDGTQKLRPGTENMKFRNIVFMASPVQLIRTATEKLDHVIPDTGLATSAPGGLSCPFEKSPTGTVIRSTDNWVSITGNMDPVGGHFFKHKLGWAYMDVAGQNSFVDDQSIIEAGDGSQPTDEMIRNALVQELLARKGIGAGPNLPINNPHSWSGYIKRHKGELEEWFAVA